MLAVIDIGTGNLRSVLNALEFLEFEACIIDDPRDIKLATKIILPGVGAFSKVADNLKAAGFADPLKETVLGGNVPMLGICVGMQILCDMGSEGGSREGFGFIPGHISHFSVENAAKQNLKIPHVGFNTVNFDTSSPLNEGLGNSADFYFTHSYHMECENKKDVVGTCDYGGEFTASIQHGHICGVQFHPEKSQSNGLRLLTNFVENF